MATPLRLIDSSTWSGSGLPPWRSMMSAPASCTSHSSSTPVASRARRVASAISGPVPSPGMKVTRCGMGAADSMRGTVAQAFRYRALDMGEFKPGLEGVVAFQTEIAEPDREGGALRYRGVDIEELVGRVPYERVWGLLVDENLDPGMPEPEPYQPKSLSGDAPADLQAETARLSSEWGLRKLVDIDASEARDDLARLSAQMMSIVAKSAAVSEGREPATDDVVARGDTAAEKFLLRWRGTADPDHVKAIDTYWICTAEHGLNASTFTARVVAP